MIEKYNIRAGVAEKNSKQGQVVIVKDASHHEENNFIQKYNLPEDIFLLDSLTPVAPRVEQLNGTDLGDVFILIIANIALDSKDKDVEKRLESHTFILSDEQLYWFTQEEITNLDTDLINKYNSKFNSLESILIYAGLTAYSHLEEELKKQKETIDKLHESAKVSTKKAILVEASETERDLILLQHTIDAMSDSYHQLINYETFINNLNNSRLIYDIKWYSQQVKQLSNLYRDLLMAVSSLFSDIMSNNLNKIMKFLSSFSLVLAGASLVGELWGINAGGLFLENSEYGSIIVFALAFLVAFMIYIYLKSKNFFDDWENISP